MAESTESPSTMSDEDPTKLCDPCKFRGVHKQAWTHCQDCLEDLCDSCEEIHCSLIATRHHELRPFDDEKKTSIKQKNVISAKMTCENHRSEIVSLLCLDHNKPTCRQCKLTKHRKCKTNTLKGVAEEAKSKAEMAQFSVKVRELTCKLQALKESRVKSKEILQSCSEEVIMEIQNFKQEIVTWANNLERDMLDEVESTREKLFADIDEEVQAAGAMVNQLDEVANSLDILGLDVPTTSLVIMLKEQIKLDEGEEIKNDIQKGIKPVKMSFNPSRELVSALSEITSMGKLNTDTKDESNICFQDITSLSNTDTKDESNICFQDITSLSKKETINVCTRGVTGCVFMPDGELVVCDGRGTDTVKLMTLDFKLRHEIKLSSRAWDVAVVSQDEVIVTQPKSKSLQVLKVSDTLEKGKSFPVDMNCWGVDFKNDMIYVSCPQQIGNGGTIKVLTMTGVTLSSFNMDQGRPYYLAVNSTGDRIMICTDTASLVLCTDTTGRVLYTYKDSELKSSLGMMVDSDDNALVCGRESNNVHVVKKDGTKHRVILTRGDGMIEPYCLAYRASDRTLVVGQWSEGKSLLAFTVNK